MVQQTSPVPDILRQIRAYLRTKHPLMSKAQPLLKQAYTLLTHENPDSPVRSVHGSDLAHLVAAMLKTTKDKAFVKFCLRMLIQLDAVGRILACSYLHEELMPMREVLTILARFPLNDQLILVNRFLHNPRFADPKFLRWAFDAITQAQGDDPEEVLLFLEQLPETGDAPSNPVQRELLRGRFGVWLTQLLKLRLSQEQVRYMTRTAGLLHSHTLAVNLARHLERADQETLCAMLDIIGLGGKKQHKLLVQHVNRFIRHPSSQVKHRALRALVRLKSNRLNQALSLLYRNHPKFRRTLFLVLLTLDGPDLFRFLKELTQTERKEIILFIVALLSSLDRKWMLKALSREARDAKQAYPKHVVQACESFITAHDEADPEFFFTPLEPEQETDRDEPEQEEGLFNQVKKLFSTMQLGRKDEISRQDKEPPSGLLTGLKQGATFDRKTFDHFSVRGQTLDKTVFAECTLDALEFSNAVLSGVHFSGCTLRNLDFEQARLEEVRFTNCRLEDCHFGSAELVNVRLENSRLTCVRFPNSKLNGITARRSRFTETDLTGVTGERWDMSQTQFSSCHFAFTTLHSSRFSGVEFLNCRFNNTFIRRTSIRNATAAACSFRECRFFSLDTDEPEFLFQEIQTQESTFEAIARRLQLVQPAQDAQQPEGMSLFTQVVTRWFFEKDTRFRLASFLRNNNRRLEWTSCMMGTPRFDFMLILPELIRAEIKPGQDAAPFPACEITGYEPDYTATEVLARYAKKSLPLAEKPGKRKPVQLEGVYTIGSTGTIAQAKSSDVDLWVCFDADKVPERVREHIGNKLAWLEDWADRTLGLEVHFFLMDLRSVVRNDFGYSDKESAGSTQAQLLKEEFYRTSVYVAGKKPAWWHLPPRLSRKGYQNSLARLRSSILLSDDEILDLGNLDDIPKEEFFGASLWQFVKAMKSPFKSAMKLALLDKYISGKDVQVLISNRVKHNLFLGKKDLWDIDPYAVLFREVFEYYKDTRQEDSQDLMRLAFLQKTGLHLSSRPSGRIFEMRGYSFMEYFFPYSESEIAAHILPRQQEQDNDASIKPANFEQVLSLGDKVVNFMLTTYRAIRHHFNTLDLDIAISEQDLTKLGRRIFSRLGPADNKVMLIPFVSSPKNLFTGLEFASEGKPGTPPDWLVRGDISAPGKMKSEQEEIRRDSYPERLLTWLVANKIFAPEIVLSAGAMAAPLSLPDIRDLLDTLHDVFPFETTFDTDINENLKSEMITRALIVLNFTTPREQKHILKACLIYSTNWGELFCVPEPKNLKLLPKDPLRFITSNTSRKIGPQTVLRSFTPAKALCPRLRL